MMARKTWAPAEVAELCRRYPNERTEDIARAMGRTLSSIYQQARKMGLKKSAAFFASEKSGRVRRGKQDPRMRATQFKPGMETWNKGRKCRPGHGGNHPNAVRHHFQPGCRLGAANNHYRPIGSYRVTRGGILEQKMTDAGNTNTARQRRWVPVHRKVWEAAHGPVPTGSIVVFRPGQKTTDPEAITADKLECITCAENMRRNTRHVRYPPEVNELIQLKGALKRKINNRRKS